MVALATGPFGCFVAVAITFGVIETSRAGIAEGTLPVSCIDLDVGGTKEGLRSKVPGPTTATPTATAVAVPAATIATVLGHRIVRTE